MANLEAYKGKRETLRGYVLTKDKSGTLLITDTTIGKLIKIKVILPYDEASIIWDSLNVGTKILVEGTMDLEYKRKKLITSIIANKITIKGSLSEDEKLDILEKYISINHSFVSLKYLFEEMSARGIEPPECNRLLNRLKQHGKIEYLERRRRIIICSKDIFESLNTKNINFK